MALTTKVIGALLLASACIVVLYWLQRSASPEGFQSGPAPVPPGPTHYLFEKCKQVSLNKVGAGFTTTRGSGSAGGFNWLCDSETSARQLIRGDDSKTPAVPFIFPNDQVCFKQEGSEGTYTCKDLAATEDEGDYTDVLSENYEITCQNFIKGYYDLSSNLTALINLRDITQDQKNTLTDSKTTLAGMIASYKCGSPTTDAARVICAAIDKTRGSYATNESTVLSILNQIIPPVAEAVKSRASVIKNVTEFQCEAELPCDLIGKCRKFGAPLPVPSVTKEIYDVAKLEATVTTLDKQYVTYTTELKQLNSTNSATPPVTTTTPLYIINVTQCPAKGASLTSTTTTKPLVDAIAAVCSAAP